MPPTIQIKDPDLIADEIRSHLFSNAQARFLGRLHIMLMICHGISVKQLALIFQLSPTTIQRWVHRLNCQGIGGLQERQGRGRPSTLSEADQACLVRDLARSPQSFGYAREQWSGRLLALHLRAQFGVSLKVRQCQNLLRSLTDAKPD